MEFKTRKEKASLPNRVNMLSCAEDEVEAKQEMMEDTVKVYRKMLPELETMPHADTLARFLAVTVVEDIQKCMAEMLKGLIRKKKFQNLLVRGNYLIAIDGTQKLFRDYKRNGNCLNRRTGEDKKPQYYVHVLESVLVLGNGVTLPLLSEFLKNENYVEGVSKQDCERKAFMRLAQRIKSIFPRMKVTLLVDGLYSCGPVIKTCRNYGWGYMITLKAGSMPEVWDEAMSLMRIAPENSRSVIWGDRIQEYA